MNKPTVSIKKHLTINHEKTAAKTGILRLGAKYKFTNLDHYQICDIFEKARIQKSFNKAQLSIMAGFGDSAYNQIARGSRLSKKSFDAFCKVLNVLDYDDKKEEPRLPIWSIEDAVNIIKKEAEPNQLDALIYDLASYSNTKIFEIKTVLRIINRAKIQDAEINEAILKMAISIVESKGIHIPNIVTAIKMLKDEGYKVMKQTTNWEEI
jgi:transcriptional regulator with XRE-family HTH domain